MHLLRKRATCHPVWLPPPFLLPSVSLRSSGHSSPSSFWCPQADERMLWWIIYLGFDWRSGASVETQSSLCFSFATQYLLSGASLVAQTVKNLPAMQETWVWSLYQEDPLVKEMANHSSILAWRIPWSEEPGGLQSIGSQRVGHDWSDLAYIHIPKNIKHVHSTGV